jgi:hypothetical protein
MIRTTALLFMISLWVSSALEAQVACLAPWRLEETLRLGSVDGADALSGINALETDARGTIYVAQWSQPWISVFDSKGNPLGRIGQGGQGPGEFVQQVTRLGWKGDTLWAAELSGPVHLFSQDGKEFGQVRFKAAVRNEGSSFSAGPLLRDGSLLGSRTLQGKVEDVNRFMTADRVPLLRFSRTGQILDTIAMVGWTSERYMIVTSDLPGGGTGRGPVVHPLQDWVGEEWLPVATRKDGAAVILIGNVTLHDGLLSGFTTLNRFFPPEATFDLLAIGIRGDTILKRTVVYRPEPITQIDQEWIRDVFARTRAGEFYPAGLRPPHGPEMVERQRRIAAEAVTFPRYFPPVRQIVAGDDGTLWLLREYRPDRSDLWEIYDGSGGLLGSVMISNGKSNANPMKPRLQILRATHDEIWGVTVDDLDVPQLHRFRIRDVC